MKLSNIVPTAAELEKLNLHDFFSKKSDEKLKSSGVHDDAKVSVEGDDSADDFESPPVMDKSKKVLKCSSKKDASGFESSSSVSDRALMKKIDDLSNKLDREICSLKRYFDEKLSALDAKLDKILKKKLKSASNDFAEVFDDENLNVDGNAVDGNYDIAFDEEKNESEVEKNESEIHSHGDFEKKSEGETEIIEEEKLADDIDLNVDIDGAAPQFLHSVISDDLDSEDRLMEKVDALVSNLTKVNCCFCFFLFIFFFFGFVVVC